MRYCSVLWNVMDPPQVQGAETGKCCRQVMLNYMCYFEFANGCKQWWCSVGLAVLGSTGRALSSAGCPFIIKCWGLLPVFDNGKAPPF